jgi:hypothetical protein
VARAVVGLAPDLKATALITSGLYSTMLLGFSSVPRDAFRTTAHAS